MNRNKVESLSGTPVASRVVRGHVQHRKLMWTVLTIGIATVLVTTTIIVVMKVKNKHNNSLTGNVSTTDISIVNELFTTINVALTTKTSHSETIITTEQLLSPFAVDNNTKWQEAASTVAGIMGKGDGLDQFNEPRSIDIDDDDRCMYISDASNDRVLKWRFDATSGVVVAGGNGKGSEIDQLNHPTDVILYKQKHSLIICDSENKRVVAWSRTILIDRQILISFIYCYGLAMDKDESLYVTDSIYHVIRRWKHGEAYGTKVAGGNGLGCNLNQLDAPRFIFVDRNASVYVADTYNGRVMKWMEDAQEGTVVARTPVSPGNVAYRRPLAGVIVDHMGSTYVSEMQNCEITRWSPGALSGETVAKLSEYEGDATILCDLSKIAFDRQGNLYVVDSRSHRIQKFAVCHSSNCF